MNQGYLKDVRKEGNGCRCTFQYTLKHGSEVYYAPNCQESSFSGFFNKEVYWEEENGTLVWVEPVERANRMLREPDLYEAYDMLDEMG